MTRTEAHLLNGLGMLLFAVGIVWWAKPVQAADSTARLGLVPSVDLTCYARKWYEIAGLPNRFQRDCVGNTTATYTSRPDGKITVLNECRKAHGRQKSAEGTARVADAKGPNPKLRVTFFWPFRGNFWIIDLDPEYRWAVVGEPARDYLSILGRAPRMDTAPYQQLVQRARQQVFDTEKLLKTSQTS